jgi:outer membrane lipoprotein SlyB
MTNNNTGSSPEVTAAGGAFAARMNSAIWQGVAIETGGMIKASIPLTAGFALTMMAITSNPNVSSGEALFRGIGAFTGGIVGGMIGSSAGPLGTIAGNMAGSYSGEYYGSTYWAQLTPSQRTAINESIENGAELADGITEAVEQAFSDLGEAITEGIENVKQAFEDAAEVTEQAVRDAYDYVAEKLGELRQWTREQIDAMKNAWNSLMEDFGDALLDARNAIRDWLEGMFGEDAPQETNPQTPIVLDMDGDGVELISINASRTYFDIDNDGFKERMATNDNLAPMYEDFMTLKHCA